MAYNYYEPNTVTITKEINGGNPLLNNDIPMHMEWAKYLKVIPQLTVDLDTTAGYLVNELSKRGMDEYFDFFVCPGAHKDAKLIVIYDVEPGISYSMLNDYHMSDLLALAPMKYDLDTGNYVECIVNKGAYDMAISFGPFIDESYIFVDSRENKKDEKVREMFFRMKEIIDSRCGGKEAEAEAVVEVEAETETEAEVSHTEVSHTEVSHTEVSHEVSHTEVSHEEYVEFDPDELADRLTKAISDNNIEFIKVMKNLDNNNKLSYQYLSDEIKTIHETIKQNDNSQDSELVIKTSEEVEDIKRVLYATSKEVFEYGKTSKVVKELVSNVDQLDTKNNKVLGMLETIASSIDGLVGKIDDISNKVDGMEVAQKELAKSIAQKEIAQKEIAQKEISQKEVVEDTQEEDKVASKTEHDDKPLRLDASKIETGIPKVVRHIDTLVDNKVDEEACYEVLKCKGDVDSYKHIKPYDGSMLNQGPNLDRFEDALHNAGYDIPDDMLYSLQYLHNSVLYQPEFGIEIARAMHADETPLNKERVNLLVNKAITETDTNYDIFKWFYHNMRMPDIEIQNVEYTETHYTNKIQEILDVIKVDIGIFGIALNNEVFVETMYGILRHRVYEEYNLRKAFELAIRINYVEGIDIRPLIDYVTWYKIMDYLNDGGTPNVTPKQTVVFVVIALCNLQRTIVADLVLGERVGYNSWKSNIGLSPMALDKFVFASENGEHGWYKEVPFDAIPDINVYPDEVFKDDLKDIPGIYKMTLDAIEKLARKTGTAKEKLFVETEIKKSMRFKIIKAFQKGERVISVIRSYYRDVVSLSINHKVLKLRDVFKEDRRAIFTTSKEIIDFVFNPKDIYDNNSHPDS